MPYDNSSMILPLASSHMHSNNYGSLHSHFGPGTYQQHPPHPPHQSLYKHDIHDPHPNHSIINHNQLLTNPLPTVNSQSSLSPIPSLSPITSLNNANNNPDYHMSHHISQHHPTYHHSPPLDHAQPPQEVSSNYQNNPQPVTIPSPPPSINQPSSNLRFEVILEAPTAAAQRIDETPITYLNKGQYYCVILQDQEKTDADFTTIIKLMFHDEAHRKVASSYWTFWLSQQASPKTARAVDIDKAASSGIKNVETKSFDRVQFQWNGKKAAKILMKFNCLSTDFSRIKGVKGIPLRVHVETKSESEQSLEKSFAKVKLFRDKGAERKLKDDQRHLDKMCDKMRGKSQETTPMMMMYAQPSNVTMFHEITGNSDAADDGDVLNLAEQINSLETEVDGGELVTLHLGKRRRISVGTDSFMEALDCDPTYIPVRKKRAVLCIYAKFPNESVYRAIYLTQLTASDLIAKLVDKLDLQGQTVSSVNRNTKRGIAVRVDDELVHQIEDEQDMEIDYTVEQDGVLLSLKF